MIKLSDQKIVSSWRKNVAPWVKAIEDDEIDTRRLVTNQAIVDAITIRAPKSVLDMGCGEGWLVRHLHAMDINARGIDVVPEFIEYAQSQGAGRFSLLAYEDISLDSVQERFDVVVCNFSLLGRESVNHLFQQIPALLHNKGYFIVQTLHPVEACGNEAYEDGWREGSWAGFSDRFVDPAPWYFRTLQTWASLFLHSGLKLVETLEPLHPNTQKPASAIFIGQRV